MYKKEVAIEIKGKVQWKTQNYRKRQGGKNPGKQTDCAVPSITLVLQPWLHTEFIVTRVKHVDYKQVFFNDGRGLFPGLRDGNEGSTTTSSLLTDCADVPLARFFSILALVVEMVLKERLRFFSWFFSLVCIFFLLQQEGGFLETLWTRYKRRERWWGKAEWIRTRCRVEDNIGKREWFPDCTVA